MQQANDDALIGREQRGRLVRRGLGRREQACGHSMVCSGVGTLQWKEIFTKVVVSLLRCCLCFLQNQKSTERWVGTFQRSETFMIQLTL